MSSAGAPRGLASSGQKPITEVIHPLLPAEEAPTSATAPDPGDGDVEEAGLTNSPTSNADGHEDGSIGRVRGGGGEDEDAIVSGDEDNDDHCHGELHDLFVAVDDPKKHVSAMETYITYRVSTRTSRVEFDLPEYCVRRRYQDFDWLRGRLEESQPTHLVPPLPEKFVMKGVVDRFSEDFVETRMKALDQFLRRVAEHPLLSFNPHLLLFLTSKDLNKRQGLALLAKVGESVRQAAVAGGYRLRSRPPEFTAMSDYLDAFSQKLGTLDRIAQRILREQTEYLAEFREYGGVYSTWATSEVEGPELRRPLQGVAGCLATCCAALEDLSESTSREFLPVLREYILYADAMKSVLKRRDQSQAEYEVRLEAAFLRKQEDGTPVPLEVERCQDRAECFNADLKADWERWNTDKRRDFRRLLASAANRNVQYYEKCQASWESLIALLQHRPLEERLNGTN
ncbi:sorting nexin-30 isoform X2 [Lampris incognitus]|uniref:sorting nexin-30 isoform X2 n=1 Tax=Lampris incognitus TaxID=2546036 RepID=UPI0024B4C2D0|nr:sorting nexin-30 isoform X2 [Lampris incognitus]